MNTPHIGQQPARTPQLHFEGLQYWRGIAALMVVYFHAVIQVRGLSGQELPLIGRSGVDIFFVLSGFVMWISTQGRDTKPMKFMARRVARIVPLYWGVTLAAAMAALAIPHMLRSTTFDLPHIIASLLFVPWENPVALITGSPEVITPIIVPGWTLNFEMLFYVLFALALLAPARRRLLAVTLLVIGTLAAATLLRDVAVPFEFYANDMILEFLAGVIIAATVAWAPVTRAGATWAVMAVAFAVLLYAEFAKEYYDLYLPRSLALGLPAAIIIALTARLEVAGRVFRAGWLAAIGDASYSIYLTHIFVITGMRLTMHIAGIELGGLVGCWAFVLTAFAASALIGWAVYKWIERPAVRVAQRLLRI